MADGAGQGTVQGTALHPECQWLELLIICLRHCLDVVLESRLVSNRAIGCVPNLCRHKVSEEISASNDDTILMTRVFVIVPVALGIYFPKIHWLESKF